MSGHGIDFAHVMLSKLIWNLAMMHIHNAGSETTANGLKPSSPWYLSLSSFSLWHPQAIRELSSFLPLLKMSLELHLQ
jgi:hypothetical protein